jgi:hypothetical protein
MARFLIGGTTLVGWTQLVKAHDEDEASQAARQGIGGFAVLGRDVLLDDVRHRVTHCRRLVTLVTVPGRRGSSH